MFDLEQAIGQWRQQLVNAGIAGVEILDELESHLRDEIGRQVELGLTEQHAYEAAVAGIGDVHALKVEFAKASRPVLRFRKALHTFYFASILFLVVVNTWTLLEFETSPASKFSGIAVVAIIGLYLVCLPHLLRSMPTLAYYRMARAIKLASSLVWLWPIWALLQATHIADFQLGIAPSAVLWCLCAAIGLSVVAYALNNESHRNGGPENPPGLLPCFGQPIPPLMPGSLDLRSSLGRFGTVDPIVKESFEVAYSEASRLGHGYIGTEHLLLGLLTLESGFFVNIMQTLGLDTGTIRVEVERFFPPQPVPAGNAGQPLTPRARKALALAAYEAKALNHATVGPQHVLLGLLLERSGVAARALRKVGLRVEDLRKEISAKTGSTAH